jgi:hypothetical protein
VKRYASIPGKLPPRVDWTELQRWNPDVCIAWKKQRDGHATIDEQVKRARSWCSESGARSS